MCNAIGERVTVYCKGAAGAISRIESTLVRIENRDAGGADVVFVKRGARRESIVMSFYSSFWLVARGWNLPDAAPLFHPAEPGITDGVTVARGRYRSCDPSWVAEFFAGPGADLTGVVAMYRDGACTIYP